MTALMISPSGVRGIVGQGLTPEVVVRFAASFGYWSGGGTVAVGSDTRTSREMFKHAVLAGLLSTGCQVIDVEICPTPTLQFMIEELQVDGGIMISGSHNPAEWNALKFIRSDGLFLYPDQIEELISLYDKNVIKRQTWRGIKTVQKNASAISRHLKKILDTFAYQEIARRKFKVVIDACNGAGSLVSPLLLRQLNCEVVEVNCTPNGFFPHPPEPIAANLTELAKTVKLCGADVGFAHDADADRLVIVSERGEILPEDYTLLLAAEATLRKRRGLIVTNVCTTNALEEVAARFACPVKRTRVGDVYVSRCMREEGAVIGGEGNGGVIIPEIHYGRDGIAAIALILEYLTEENKSVSQLASRLPRRWTIKEKLSLKQSFSDIRKKLQEEFADYEFDLIDGLKIIFPKGWVHLRLSRTEPVLRIISEAKDKGTATMLHQRVLSLL